jgi:hypothetical protein
MKVVRGRLSPLPVDAVGLLGVRGPVWAETLLKAKTNTIATGQMDK